MAMQYIGSVVNMMTILFRQQISRAHFNNKSTISSSGLPYRINVCALVFLVAPFHTSKVTEPVNDLM